MSPTANPASKVQVDHSRTRSTTERLMWIRRGYSAFRRFFRFEYLTFSLLLPLLGAATVPTPPTVLQLVGFLAVAVAFHIFMCLQNDLVDLPLDRTQPARADYPLVKGTVRPLYALAIAVLQIPIAFALTAWQGGSPESFAALGVGFVAMTIYNVWGKRTPFPILTDVIQGIGFASMCAYGAAILGPVTRLTFIVFFGVVVWMMLANLLGGLRDLKSDLTFGVLTTPIQLSARPEGEFGEWIPGKLRAYAYVCQTIMIALTVIALVQNDFGYSAIMVTTLVSAVLILSAIAATLLVSFFRAASDYPRMIKIGERQLPASASSMIVLLAPALDRRLLLVILIVFLLPHLFDGFRFAYHLVRRRGVRLSE